MVLASRGITARERHLMLNLKSLLPHSKSGMLSSKLSAGFVVNLKLTF